MSENNTGFNERDRRCAAVQLILSTDPSYDNRTIASTFKIQIRTVQRLRAQLNALDDPFEVVEQKAHIMPPHIFEVGLKVNTKVYLDVLKSVVIPWCNQVVGGRPWVWQQDLALAHKSKETQAWLQKECYDFVPFSHWPPSSWTRWTTWFGHTLRTSPAWPPTAPKPTWSPPSAEYSPSSLVEKACSQFRIRIEAAIEATLNRCQLYYIIKLPELIFFNKSFKIKL